MKPYLLIGLLIFFSIENSAFANIKVKNSKSSTTTSSQVDWYGRGETHPFLLNVGPGAMSSYGSVGVSLNAAAAIKVTTELPIYVGLDTAILFGSKYSYLYDYEREKNSGVSFQTLASAYYYYTIPKLTKLHAYGGLSLGPVINSGDVFMGAFIRSGAHWDLTPKIAAGVELKAGIVSEDFLVLPSALVTFKL